MLSRWQEHKGIRVSERLAEVLRDSRRLRPCLERLAYKVHGAQAAHGKGSDLLRKDLLKSSRRPGLLRRTGPRRGVSRLRRSMCGLLVGHGGEEGQRPQAYAFPHRTFQEYLAGCHLASGRAAESAREYWRHAGEGDYWAVAAHLGAEELLYNNPTTGTQALLDLAYPLCSGAEPDGARAWRAALWSGHMAALVGAEQVGRDAGLPEAGSVYLERLQKRLACLIERGELRPVDRRACPGPGGDGCRCRGHGHRRGTRRCLRRPPTGQPDGDAHHLSPRPGTDLGRLPLRGLDVGTADAARAQQALSLAKVYVDLDTTAHKTEVVQTAEDLPRSGRESTTEIVVRTRPISALEATIEQRRLVLLGDPGGGKSTFVNHLAHCLAMHTLEPRGQWLAHLPGWPQAEGAIVPLVVILRDFARSLPEPLPTPQPSHL